MVRKQFQCPECGSREGHRSRPRNLAERHLLRLLLLLPVRCSDCYRRYYVSIFTRIGSSNRAPDVHRKAA
jgi:hypothetical protein